MRFLPKAAFIAILATSIAWNAEAVPVTYVAKLSGPAEEPANNSPGIGTAQVTIDTVAHILDVRATFSDLMGTTVAAHIHGPTALPFEGTAGVITAVPTFPGFLLGVTSGTYSQVFDLTQAPSFNPSFVAAQGSIAAAEAALAAALAEGRAYFNIHTTSFSGGEIRGFLTPIPLPAALYLLLGACAALAGMGWRRRAA